MLERLDFTFEKYRQLCQAILRTGYHVVTIQEYLSDPRVHRRERVVMLRHDVDTRPENARQMGALERDLGLQATYYFRMVPATYKPELIKTLSEWGHEIGYHYETLSKARGDFDLAIELFQQELAAMRALCQVKTICMHGKSISRWDNRALWERYDFREFDLIGECYLSIDYTRVVYLTDTGRTWGDSRANVRDKAPIAHDLADIVTTDDLICALEAGRHEHWLLQIHPNKWARNVWEWQYCLARDMLINLAKQVFIPLRSLLG